MGVFRVEVLKRYSRKSVVRFRFRVTDVEAAREKGVAALVKMSIDERDVVLAVTDERSGRTVCPA